MVDIRWRIPPDLILPEYPADDITPAMQEHMRRIRTRFGLIEDYDRHAFNIFVSLAANACECFRWTETQTATFTGQTDFIMPAGKELEDNAYYIVFVRTDFYYLNFNYNIIPPYTLRLFVGVLEGEPVTVYALKHDDVQDIHYEHCTVAAMPYAFSPPVTVDRSPGRQLVFARGAFRFLDSIRAADRYTVSNTLNTVTLTAGLGPPGERAALFRLRECCVDWHEEILATAAGQTVFEPTYIGNILRDHGTGRMIVASRTDFRHPGVDYVTNPTANTLTLTRFPMGFGQPLNIFCFR